MPETCLVLSNLFMGVFVETLFFQSVLLLHVRCVPLFCTGFTKVCVRFYGRKSFVRNLLFWMIFEAKALMSRTLLLKLYVQTGSRFVFVNSTSFYPLIGSTPCSKAPATSNARTELRVMVKYTYTLKDAEGHLQKSRVSLLLKHLAVLDSCMPTLTVPRS